jgi:hypothetical protein
LKAFVLDFSIFLKAFNKVSVENAKLFVGYARNQIEPDIVLKNINEPEMTFMQHIVLVFVGAVLLLILYGCTGTKTTASPSSLPGVSPTVTDTLAVTGPETEETPDIYVSGQADAYYLIFQELINTDSGLNGGIEYLALDLSGVKSIDMEYLTKLVKSYCDDNNLTLLLDDFDGLKDAGYIKNLSFENGMLISFVDQSVSDQNIVTDAKKWRSGTGAVGATYTVSFKDDAWEITDVTGSWIS